MNSVEFCKYIVNIIQMSFQKDIINVEENQKIGTKLNSSIKASDLDTTANLTVEIDWNQSYAVKNSRRITNETDLPRIK